MSSDYQNSIGTLPPGFLAPADGNYAPDAPPNLVATDSPSDTSSMGLNGLVDAQQENRRSGKTPLAGTELLAGAFGAVADLGPNNERLEDIKPELVNALRELVRQYRQEGIVA
ncbi:MAG: hypothetical protein WA894_13460, partial [Candidatus Acidiferrum sp.]